MIQNERSDALSRLRELPGALEAKFLEVGQLSENSAGMVKNERSDALSGLGELQGLLR